MSLTQRQIWVVVVGVSLGLFVSALDGTIVATALPTIAGDLGGISKLPWVLTIYLLTNTAATPLWGKLSDIFGRRLMYQAALVLFIAGSMLCGVAPTLGALILARGLQGIGGGGLMAVAFAIIGDVVSPRERGRYFGFFTSIWAVAGVLGPLVGGTFTDHIGWRWIFYVNVPIGLVALIVTWTSLRIPVHRVRHRIDFEGAALFAASVTSALLVLTWGGKDYSWTSPTIISLSLLSVALAAAFIAWENRAVEPLVPLRLFTVRNFTISMIVAFVLSLVMQSTSAYMPLWFQAVSGKTATVSGLLLIPIMTSMAIFSAFVGKRVSATGRYKHYPWIGVSVCIVGIAGLARMHPSTSLLVIGALLGVLGIGVGVGMPVTSIASQNAAPHRDLGAAVATITFIRTLGGALGVAIFGAVMFGRLTPDVAPKLPAGMDTTRDGIESLLRSPAAIRTLDAPVRHAVIDGLGSAMNTTFLVLIPVLVLGVIASRLMRSDPLRGFVGDEAPAEVLVPGDETVAPAPSLAH